MPLNHEQDRERKNKENAAKRDIQVPPCLNPKRKQEAEQDIFTWLVTYFPIAFDSPFTEQRKEIVREILSCASEKRTQAIAAPRGIGKSSIASRVLLYMILTGKLRFVVIVAAKSEYATDFLDEMKDDLVNNPLLAEDYPDVVVPLLDVDGSSRKCALQTVKGKRTRILWQPKRIRLPKVDGNRCGGAKIYAVSLDGAVRGLRKDSERPDFVLIDDPETDESARSDLQIKNRSNKIDKDLSGLAKQGNRMGMLMLTTIQTKICLSLQYTDPKQRPAWNGKRWRAIAKWPERRDMWDEYIFMRKQDQQNGDPDGSNARRFYRDNREEMDAGHEVSNPYAIPEGCESALQGLYDYIADKGLESFLTEFQNDPPTDENENSSIVTESVVATKINGLQQTVVPKDAAFLVMTIDLGKYRCYWQVTAWMNNDSGFVVDYGFADVLGSFKGSDKIHEEQAIMQTLRILRERATGDCYFDEAGEQRQINLVMVDSGDFTDAAYLFCLESGNLFVPTKGVGDTYKAIPSQDKYIGNHYYISGVMTNDRRMVQLYSLDSNHWKRVMHDAWLVPTKNDDASWRANSLSLFDMPIRADHLKYGRMIAAEQYTEIVTGNKMRRIWKRSGDNHWGDCCYMAFAAREVCKVRRAKAMQQARQRQAAPVSQPGMFPAVDFGSISFS